MKSIFRYLPALFFLALASVTVLALIPGPSVPSVIQFWDKAQHALAFGVLVIIGCCAFPPRIRLVFVGLLAHGALIEILQATLTTTRTGDVLDWFADGVGILVGVSVYLLVVSRFVGRFQFRN